MDENKTMNNNPEAGEKTFTQEQVNAIVGERLAKEKAKGDAAFAEREKALAQRELMLTAREKLSEEGLPADLVDVLNLSSKEAMDKAISTLKSMYSKIKEEAQPSPISGAHRVFRGAVPADSNVRTPNIGGDSSLRKAMGLPK
jgi:hypothetical protein